MEYGAAKGIDSKTLIQHRGIEAKIQTIKIERIRPSTITIII